jgi:phenylalanyl-tRNA synthetase alpha chain
MENIDLRRQLGELESNALASLADVTDLKDLEQWRVQYLGKKGSLSNVLRGMGVVPAEERPAVCQAAKLAAMFVKNFEQFAADVSDEIKAAGPVSA